MRPARKSPLPPDEIYQQEETEEFLSACVKALKALKDKEMKLSTLGGEVPKTNSSYSYKDLLKQDPQRRFLVRGVGGDVTVVSRPSGISNVRKPKTRKAVQKPKQSKQVKPIEKVMPPKPIGPPPSKRPQAAQLWRQENPIREAFLLFSKREQAWMPSTSKTICRHQKFIGGCPLFESGGSERCTYYHGKYQKYDKAKMAGCVRVMKDWDPKAGLLLKTCL